MIQNAFMKSDLKVAAAIRIDPPCDIEDYGLPNHHFTDGAFAIDGAEFSNTDAIHVEFSCITAVYHGVMRRGLIKPMNLPSAYQRAPKSPGICTWMIRPYQGESTLARTLVRERFDMPMSYSRHYA
jgi:hypothetical protein